MKQEARTNFLFFNKSVFANEWAPCSPPRERGRKEKLWCVFRVDVDLWNNKSKEESILLHFRRQTEVVGLTPAKTSNDLNGEFDPGSELTLAECITHASRAEYVARRI